MVLDLTRKATVNRYRDLDLNMTAHPVTGDISPLTGEDAIKRSIKNLVLLNFYEVPFSPSIGSDVLNLLFENFSPVIESDISDAIIETITKYEPRVEIEEVNVEADRDGNGMSVSLLFNIVNQPDPLNFNFVIRPST